MTDAEIQFAKNAAGRWLEHWVKQCRKDHGIDRCPTYADAMHSALLRRLLSGKAPTGHVPPLAFAYPWHELEEGNACSILEHDGPWHVEDESRKIVICQSNYSKDDWDDEAKTGTLRCDHNGQLYRVFVERQTRMIQKVKS